MSAFPRLVEFEDAPDDAPAVKLGDLARFDECWEEDPTAFGEVVFCDGGSVVIKFANGSTDCGPIDRIAESRPRQ